MSPYEALEPMLGWHALRCTAHCHVPLSAAHRHPSTHLTESHLNMVGWKVGLDDGGVDIKVGDGAP